MPHSTDPLINTMMPTTAMMAAMIHKILAFMLGIDLSGIRPTGCFV